MASSTESEKRGPDRRGLAIAGAVLLACGGLVGYGVLNTEEKPEPAAVPTAEVTYEVTGTGTVEISYAGGAGNGAVVVEKAITLPWKKTVQVPVGSSPSIGVILDGKGGEAGCTLAVRGKHVQRATAAGTYGRATCAGPELTATTS
ncbi:hypothetical protein QWM81_18110 [Streptomyces ficellus]|uniref:MmpS family membrane protein n=1 Tax=Streptomyces ficellus TaxID=1977088 RepID=A0ABT7Z9I3_9ACTN|nr:hypothetical protein [Streptomyces ficellus]MDN3295932.1 hypothetical protein [Streptomyces ficellus]